MRMTWRYVMSESCFMIVFQDVQLLVTYLCLKWARHFHRHTVKATMIVAVLIFWLRVLGKLFMTSCHTLCFRFPVPYLGSSTGVVSILSLIFQLRDRPGSSEAQTACIVSICAIQWWSHQQLHANLRSLALARLHQLKNLLLITSPYSNYSSPSNPWIWDISMERDSERVFV